MMVEVKRLGLTRLDDQANGPKRTVNIIFVHGHNGHPLATWQGFAELKTLTKTRSSTSNASVDHGDLEGKFVFWPVDLLVRDVPQAAVWTFGYMADVLENAEVDFLHTFWKVSRNLEDSLRKAIDLHSIIFVAHGLGGLIVENVIQLSYTFELQTRCIIYLGTPHRNRQTISATEFGAPHIAATQAKPLKFSKLPRERFSEIAVERRIELFSLHPADPITKTGEGLGMLIHNFPNKLDYPNIEAEYLVSASIETITECSTRQDEVYQMIIHKISKKLESNFSDEHSSEEHSPEEPLHFRASSFHMQEMAQGIANLNSVDSGYASYGSQKLRTALFSNQSDAPAFNTSSRSYSELELRSLNGVFVEHLMKVLAQDHSCATLSLSAVNGVPGLLYDFATKLKPNQADDSISQILHYMLKHRNKIVLELKDYLDLSDNMKSHVLRRLEKNLVVHQDSPLHVLISSEAFTWLISQLTNTLHLSVPIKDHNAYLKQAINDLIPSIQRLGTRIPRVVYSMSFSLDCDISKFLTSFLFHGMFDIEQTISSFITLTSDGRDIQALTVSEYLHQIWPASANWILTLIAQIARDGFGATEYYGDTITGSSQASALCIRITGVVSSIVELAQQVAWLGCVFQMPAREGFITKYKPFVQELRQCDFPPAVDKSSRYPEFFCRIRYILEDHEIEKRHDICWSDLFRYPVVASGFPILKRPESVHGIEISLGKMLALSHSQHVGNFDHFIVIKGLSNLFFLTEHQAGISVWHHLGHPNGPYISCSSIPSNFEVPLVSVNDILRERHFVGWCSEMEYRIEGLDGNSDQIEHSGQQYAPFGSLLYGKKIRRGLRTPEEHVYTADHKTNPWRSHAQNYAEKLEILHKRAFVLWDSTGQRGWLTNGTSALLQLVLTSLDHGNDDPFKDEYCLDKRAIQVPLLRGLDTAAKVLLNKYNRRLPIIDDGAGAVCFEDRVNDLYFLLITIIEHQVIANEVAGAAQDELSGWDFMDVADISHDPLQPRTFVPDKDYCSWLGLVSELNAVTLFGRGFGELFEPKDMTLCSACVSLATDNCYLAAHIGQLQQIMGKYGKHYSQPKQLTSHNLWPILSATFEPCSHHHVETKQKDRIQVLVPSSIYRSHPDQPAMREDLPKAGAVIFGPLPDLQWIDPSYIHTGGIPLHRGISQTEDRFADSGIGGSVSGSSGIIEKSVILTRNDYSAAIICALPKELKAIRFLFEPKHPKVDVDFHDTNTYAFGNISGYNIVAACLPSGDYGTCSAATVATNLVRSFPNIVLCLLVGIGGGAPTAHNDVRLGDVVISHPTGHFPGIVKHDFEKIVQGHEAEQIGSLQRPPPAVLTAMSDLRSDPDVSNGPLKKSLDFIASRDSYYAYPGADQDQLYESSFPHISPDFTCTECTGPRVQRKPRPSTHPQIHYGLIASGDKVMKDASVRDRIAQKTGALCFEMEAAGVANILPGLVIRGICDYADSHKNKVWQEYACASAAAFAKLLLEYVRLGNGNGNGNGKGKKKALSSEGS